MSAPTVFITVNGGIAECVVAGDVNVVLIDWDDDGERHPDQVADEIDAVRSLPTTGQMGKWRAEALKSLCHMQPEGSQCVCPSPITHGKEG